MLILQNSLDWPKSEAEIEKMKKMFPEFKHDVDRFVKHIKAEVVTLSTMEIEYRNKRSPGILTRINQQLNKINTEIKKIEQTYLMALLAKG